MASYLYDQVVQKCVNVEPCPCCRSEDIRFGEYDGDESVCCSSANVECTKCGHVVRVDERDLNGRYSGKQCQMMAIDKWNRQSREYGGERGESKNAIDRKEIERLYHENIVLKSAISYLGYVEVQCRSERCELMREFYNIMTKFNEDIRKGKANG